MLDGRDRHWTGNVKPMPPMGGATLTYEQARAVVACVMNLSEDRR